MRDRLRKGYYDEFGDDMDVSYLNNWNRNIEKNAPLPKRGEIYVDQTTLRGEGGVENMLLELQCTSVQHIYTRGIENVRWLEPDLSEEQIPD